MTMSCSRKRNAPHVKFQNQRGVSIVEFAMCVSRNQIIIGFIVDLIFSAFINTCVGYKNYRYFLQFLFSTACLCYYGAYISFYILILAIRKHGIDDLRVKDENGQPIPLSSTLRWTVCLFSKIDHFTKRTGTRCILCLCVSSWEHCRSVSFLPIVYGASKHYLQRGCQVGRLKLCYKDWRS